MAVWLYGGEWGCPTEKTKQQVRDSSFDKIGIVLYSIFWSICIPVHSIGAIIYILISSICGKTNSIFQKLDAILDAPPKEKINKKIIGYSINEETITYPTLIRAQESGAKRIYRHYADESHELV